MDDLAFSHAEAWRLSPSGSKDSYPEVTMTLRQMTQTSGSRRSLYFLSCGPGRPRGVAPPTGESPPRLNLGGGTVWVGLEARRPHPGGSSMMPEVPDLGVGRGLTPVDAAGTHGAIITDRHLRLGRDALLRSG
jgi:hypothetical protein